MHGARPYRCRQQTDGDEDTTVVFGRYREADHETGDGPSATACWIRNGSNVPLKNMRAQVCVMFKGAPAFAENCAVCHGEKGEGNRDLGAPRLNDAVWLYGSDKPALMAQIAKPRHGVMPAWAGRLDETTIKQLAVFVHSLGGGEQPRP